MEPSGIFSNSPQNENKRRSRKVILIGTLCAGAIIIGLVAWAGISYFRTLNNKNPSTASNENSASEHTSEENTNGSSSPSSSSQNSSSSSSPTAKSGTNPQTKPGSPVKNGKPSSPTSPLSTTTTPKQSGSTSPSPTPTPTAPPQPGTPTPTSDACGSYVYKPNGERWVCVMADNFDGTQLNTKIWSVATSPNDFFQWFECYYNRPENVNVSGGTLNLTSRRENPQIPCGWRGGVDFSGGMVRTYQKLHINKGRVDIRIKIPQSKGQFGIGTSLWMLPYPSGQPGAGDAGWYGPWPASGEIDIAEMYGPYDDYANPSIHYNVKSGHKLQSSCGGENYNAETVTARCNVPGAATGFHTYSVEWTTNTITMLYDGKKVLVDKWDSTQGGTAPFDKPFFLNITQGFANMPIPGPYSAVLPATSQIDYVKIWQ